MRRGNATTSQTRGTRGGKGSKGHGVGVVCDKKGDGDSNKGNGNEGGRQATVTRAMVTAMVTMWEMAMAMRLAGNKEDKGKRGKGDGNSNKGGS